MGQTTFLFAALAHTTLSHNPVWVDVGHLKGLALTEVNVILNYIRKTHTFYFFCGEISYIISSQPVLVQ